VAAFAGDQQSVTSLAASHDSSQLAVGYRDGVVRVFDVASGDCTVAFSGHCTQVSTLAYDAHSMRLVSGGLVCDTAVHSSASLVLHSHGIGADLYHSSTDILSWST